MRNACVALLLAFVAISVAPIRDAVAAPAPANSVIGNQATATYVDSAGVTRPVTSNTVQTTVQQVKSFTLTQAGAKTAPVNQQVCYPHTITNTGNGTDLYTLNAASTGGAFAHTSLAYFADTNQDGLPDSSTPITAPVSVIAGASYNFVVCGTTPPTALPGQAGTVGVSVSDTNAPVTTQTQTNTTTIGAAAVNATKKLSSVPPPGYIPVAGGASPNAGPLYVILDYANTGAIQADNVRLADPLPTGWRYVPGSGRWTVSGPSTALSDAPAGDPAGISYQAPVSAASGTVEGTITAVAPGASGSLYFQVTIAAGLQVTSPANAAATTNTANIQYSYTSGGVTVNVPASPTNTVQYVVAQTAAMTVNGSATTTGLTDAEPITVASGAPGQAVTFIDYVWNRGSSPDSFDLILRDGASTAPLPANGSTCNPASTAVPNACTFPTGTTFQILASNGSTPLLDTNGNGVPDTGTIPVPSGGSCTSPYVISADGLACGYPVAIRATLPTTAGAGNNSGNGYRVTLEGRSRFDTTVAETAPNVLASITPTTADITNNAPVGNAAALGTGPNNAVVQVTNNVTPSATSTTTTVFTLYANNTGPTPAVYNLSSSFVSVPAASGLTTPPAGWVVTLRESGNGTTCAAPLGNAITTTGTNPVPAGGSRLYCAEVTVPATTPSTPSTPTPAPAGDYVLQFGIANQTTPTIADTILDRVAVASVRAVTLTPNNAQSTVPGGSVVYTHTLANNGNAAEVVTFPANTLANSQVPSFAWTSTAYLDANNNGIYDAGVDTPIVPGVTTIPSLAPNTQQAVFVVVGAPATVGSPPNVTTLTATLAGGVPPVSATDTTTLTDGVRLVKYQQSPAGTGSCTTTPTAALTSGAPAAPWSTAALAAGPNTAAGRCISYLIVGTNGATANATNINVSDLVPPNTTLETGCGAPTVTGPIALTGSYATGFTGTIAAQSSPTAATPLAPNQSFTLQFCVRINPASAVPGTSIVNSASGTQQIGSTTQSSTSNTVGATVAAATGAPTLSKVFGGSAIEVGGSVPLSFRIVNGAGAGAQTGIGFTDTLPSGLRFTATPTSVISGGCTGNVVFGSPSAVTVSGLNMPAGTALCEIAINGVTNAGTTLNPSCATSPSAFTNGSAAISGLANLVNGVTNQCLEVNPVIVVPPNRNLFLAKSISASQGNAPSGPYRVTIQFSNATAAGSEKTNVSITDTLPAGMVYVPGSLAVTYTGVVSAALAGATGSYAVNGISGAYTTSATEVGITIASLSSGGSGSISFDVNIAQGVAAQSVLTNIATGSFTDVNGVRGGPVSTNPVEFRVLASESITLRGVTLPAVDPGSTVVFNNLLTNNTSRTDTFDITLSGSNFPPGTILQLYQPDGVTRLVDTNGNGAPDTGPVAAGATYQIVVRAILPAGVAGGPFQVTKNAQSVTNPQIRTLANDIVATVNDVCRVVLEPDNSGRVVPGDSVVYAHTLTNLGTCTETVTFPAGFLGNSTAGWTAQIVIDNPATGGQSIVGVFDPTDTVVTPTTTLTLPPGARIVFLNRVTAPTTAGQGASNVTTFGLNTSRSGALGNRDTTITGTGSGVDNTIQGFIDNRFQRPTAWAFIGQNLFLRAAAQACNQQPDIIERRTIIITGPNGEREEIVAIETGPNTGVFEASGLPVKMPPVTPGNTVLEGNPLETYSVELIGCGRRITTTVTLIDPSGVVFDSRSNEPVAGAVVRIVTATGGVCSNNPATVTRLVNGSIVSAPNTVTTGADGRFDFPLVPPGDYCVLVSPPNGYTFTSVVPFTQLPGGRNILATGPTTGGSYGGGFRVGPETGPVIVDIPVDPGRLGGLFIQKTVLRGTVEVGELTDYTVTINNNTGVALSQSDVLLTDSLPAGFSYVPGTARLDGKPLADPQGGVAPRLVFNIGRMSLGQQLRLTYRVRVGPGAMQGDGINRVVATYRVNGTTRFSESNVAAAQVRVVGGVFSDKTYVTGKVFMDCDKDGVQTSPKDADKNKTEREVGIPGVRLYLEDGTNVITDAEGKFSFYGLNARTHVLKVDRTTLPAGIDVKDFVETSNRNLGKADSIFIDAKFGELHRANFAIRACAPPVLAEVQARRRAAASLNTEVDGRLQQQLITDPNNRPAIDVKTLPSSGTVGTSAPVSAAPNTDANSILPYGSTRSASTPEVLGTIGFSPLAPRQPLPSPAVVDRTSGPAPTPALESVLPGMDNSLGFVSLKDGDILAFAQTSIQVKGSSGTTFSLSVNGKAVAESRVGKKSVLEDKKLQAWEYVGVDLVEGANTLTLKQTDAFGNARGETSIKVTAPGAAAKLVIEFPPSQYGGATADGKTPATVTVRVVDAKGVPVTSRTAVTLSSSMGRWQVEDLNSNEPGIQTFVVGGKGEFSLLPPNDPGQAQIVASAGSTRAEGRLDFLPEVRQLLAAGVIEGVLNLRKLDSRALVPTRAQDGFEEEIQHLSRTWNDGKYQAGARAAMFIKGKIKGEYLLTLAYDSDKNTRERLFRDIQPDEFYPVYGDSSIRGFDAQSTSRFYVRIDNKKSYLLYGDYNTSTASEARKLANYNRSLTGIKQHFENSFISANVFASRDTTRQLQQEFRANGTSGPFTLSNARNLINSEKVEILTRDRSQSAIIIRAIPLARFADYELEPLTGRILLKAPVATFDELLNPNFIRVTYEIDQGGEQFWVTGADAQVKLGENFEVGGIVVDDRNPLDKFRMYGVNAIAKLADKTFIIAELAQTNRDRIVGGLAEGEKRGNAGRIEFIRRDDAWDARLYAGRADAKFDNISSGLSSGRTEIGGNVSLRLDDKTRLKAEALRSEDTLTNARRDGVLAAVERTLDNGLRLEVGLRHARETSTPATTASGPLPTEVTSIRTRVTGDIPGVKDAAAYVELEVDPKDTDRKIAAVGGEYKLPNGGRLYGRHEFISSLTGPYGLNTIQRQNTSVIGISTDYMKDGNLFSEYRIRDAISGGDAEAAIGLRNLWTISEGLKLQTGFERVHAFTGAGTGESIAATFGLEYTANPLWKGSTRLELRDAKTSESVLSTVAVASKLNRDWTLLGRNTYSLIRNKGGQTGENEQDRLQAGVAYRDTESDVLSGLARIEHRAEKDTTQPEVTLKRTVDLLSVHANLQPVRPFTFSGRYATKWVKDDSNGIKSKNNGQLLSARAIWEIAPRWDVSLHGSTMWSNASHSKQYGVGLELGFMVMENLWLSGGYNFHGYRDDDFANGEYTNKGAYLRLRYKFDEDLFGSATRGNPPLQQPSVPVEKAASAPISAVPAPVATQPPAAATVSKTIAAPTPPAPVPTAPAPAPVIQEVAAPAPSNVIDTSSNCRLPAPAKKSVKKTPTVEPKAGSESDKPVAKKKRKAKPTVVCDAGQTGELSGVGADQIEEEADDEVATETQK
jgi:uncharacterized repeat protein (TIGR01451 family)